jgi:hypothetical protein
VPRKSGPRHWRDLAKETRAKAGKATSPRFKRMLLGLASSYEHLARRIWRRSRDTKTQNEILDRGDRSPGIGSVDC